MTMTMAPETRWDEWNAGGGPRFPHEKLIQFTFRSFKPDERRGLTVLDLGCGSGVHTAFLAAEGCRVTGCDVSPVGIENTRRRLAAAGLEADLFVADLATLSLGARRFRLVVSVGVLDCAGVAAARAALPVVFEAMEPGARGLFVFASDRDFRVVGPNPYGLHGYTRAEVEEVFAQPWSERFLDRYITTYRGGETEQNDWLVTVTK
jgi:cyclopropane fatty-acyl-phospholipid synthase-like methyltransferase